MNPILLFTLLCPDTAYFREPFTVHIVQTVSDRPEPAPPGYPMPDAWEARSGFAGIIGEGRFTKVPDSVTAFIPGPGAYLDAGSKVSVEIGTYDPAKGQIKALPGVGCMTVMKVRPPVGIRRPGRPGTVWKARQGIRPDGRFAK